MKQVSTDAHSEIRAKDAAREGPVQWEAEGNQASISGFIWQQAGKRSHGVTTTSRSPSARRDTSDFTASSPTCGKKSPPTASLHLEVEYAPKDPDFVGKRLRPSNASIDRLKSGDDYEKQGNIRWMCWRCNAIKQGNTVESGAAH